MRVRLLVINGKHKGLEIKLPYTQFVIGRDQRCHLRPASTDISRCHCAIARHGRVVQVCDLKSANGTFVNGQRVSGIVRVHDGDVLTVGPLRLQFLIEAETTAEPGSDIHLDWLVREPDADEEAALDASKNTTLDLPAYSGDLAPRKYATRGDFSGVDTPMTAVGGQYLREYLFRRRKRRFRREEGNQDPNRKTAT